MPDRHEPEDLQVLLARLWVTARPTVLERIATLGRAADAAATGGLDSARREAARADAHKLVGLLGTYGIPEGSELARAAEQRLRAGGDLDGPALAALADRLRALVEDRDVGPAA